MKMLKRRAASCGVNPKISKETLFVKSNCVFLMGKAVGSNSMRILGVGSTPCVPFSHTFILWLVPRGALWLRFRMLWGRNPRFIRHFNDWEMDMV